MRALTGGARGVSGRAMRSVRAGTSGAYLRASLTALGPRVWMIPTPLSVKSLALMSLAQGLAVRLCDDVLPVLPVAVGAGRVLGVGDVQDQAGDP